MKTALGDHGDMRCSGDLRQRVVDFVRSGGSKAEAARRFKVGQASVYRWLKPGGMAYKRPGPQGPRKLDWDGYYAGLTQEQLGGIEAVAMDMWAPYIQATQARVPEAAEKIVFDRFHIMGHVGKAVDTVRKQEHRELMASGDETLKGSTYLWLYSRENVPEQRRDEFEVLMRKELKVGRTWAIKEALRRLWHYGYPASGWKF